MATEKTSSARPKVQTDEDAVKQAHEDALSPSDKHEAYLADLDRLHAESVVGPDKKTPPVGQHGRTLGALVPAVPDSGPDAGSNLVSGRGTNSLTFTMPSSPRYAVQSVVATIDNSAGADTTATLTMADTNGAVIAKRAQGETIDAGATGTATFALRLDGSATRGGIRFGKLNVGNFLAIRTTGSGAASEGYGFWLRAPAGIKMNSAGNGTDIYTEGGGYSIDTSSGAPPGGGYDVFTDGGIVRLNAGGGTVTIRSNGGDVVIRSAGLGFFNSGPVAQQATPVTLADVIALLQAYGLSA